uniref:Uncharacterized protein n=2 Tax=Alexandrium monilatum TaxID=311494 RepID=A0A7S4V0G6_9DINO
MLTKQMNGEDERVRARMERLADFPAVRELQRLVTSDADWQEVAEVLRPKSQAVYEAARTASLRTRSLTPDEDRVVVYGVRASEIALAVAAILAGLALAACAPKLAELRDTWGAEKSLPLYGLQDGEAPRTAPLLYGTPLMPLS